MTSDLGTERLRKATNTPGTTAIFGLKDCIYCHIYNLFDRVHGIHTWGQFAYLLVADIVVPHRSHHGLVQGEFVLRM